MEQTAWFYLAVGFCSGLLGALGLGGGSILILCLTLWTQTDQIAAQGINLLFFLPCAAVALLFHRKEGLLDKSMWKYALISGAVCAVGGSLLAKILPADLLRKLFGILLLWCSIRSFLPQKEKSGT